MGKALLFLLITACTTNQADYERDKVIESKKIEQSSQGFKESGDHFKSEDMDIEWKYCQGASTKVVLSVNETISSAACSERVPQTFLEAGFSVLLIKEPVNGQNFTELGSSDSVEIVGELLQSKQIEPVGIWAHGEQTILGGRLARQIELQWAIFSEGIFDFEKLLKNKNFNSLILKFDSLEFKNRELAIEERSLSWDYDGMPSLVYLYFHEGSLQAVKDQSENLANVLSAAQIEVQSKAFRGKQQVLDEPAHSTMISDALKFIAIVR